MSDLFSLPGSVGMHLLQFVYGDNVADIARIMRVSKRWRDMSVEYVRTHVHRVRFSIVGADRCNVTEHSLHQWKQRRMTTFEGRAVTACMKSLERVLPWLQTVRPASLHRADLYFGSEPFMPVMSPPFVLPVTSDLFRQDWFWRNMRYVSLPALVPSFESNAITDASAIAVATLAKQLVHVQRLTLPHATTLALHLADQVSQHTTALVDLRLGIIMDGIEVQGEMLGTVTAAIRRMAGRLRRLDLREAAQKTAFSSTRAAMDAHVSVAEWFGGVIEPLGRSRVLVWPKLRHLTIPWDWLITLRLRPHMLALESMELLLCDSLGQANRDRMHRSRQRGEGVSISDMFPPSLRRVVFRGNNGRLYLLPSDVDFLLKELPVLETLRLAGVRGGPMMNALWHGLLVTDPVTHRVRVDDEKIDADVPGWWGKTKLAQFRELALDFDFDEWKRGIEYENAGPRDRFVRELAQQVLVCHFESLVDALSDASRQDGKGDSKRASARLEVLELKIPVCVPPAQLQLLASATPALRKLKLDTTAWLLERDADGELPTDPVQEVMQRPFAWVGKEWRQLTTLELVLTGAPWPDDLAETIALLPSLKDVTLVVLSAMQEQVDAVAPRMRLLGDDLLRKRYHGRLRAGFVHEGKTPRRVVLLYNTRRAPRLLQPRGQSAPRFFATNALYGRLFDLAEIYISPTSMTHVDSRQGIQLTMTSTFTPGQYNSKRVLFFRCDAAKRDTAGAALARVRQSVAVLEEACMAQFTCNLENPARPSGAHGAATPDAKTDETSDDGPNDWRYCFAISFVERSAFEPAGAEQKGTSPTVGKAGTAATQQSVFVPLCVAFVLVYVFFFVFVRGGVRT